jgi:hypothetical protein
MPHWVTEPIRAEEVAQIFSDQSVAMIARAAGLPSWTNIPLLAAALRASAGRYAIDARVSGFNAIRKRVDALIRAARRWDYSKMVAILSRPDDVMQFLKTRALLLQQRTATEEEQVRWRVPLVAELLDPARQEEAVRAIWRLAVVGGAWVPGRNRPGGKRSLKCELELHAPASKSQLWREAERNFVIFLRIDYYAATGRMPPNTARRDMLGPFARMVAECLRLTRVPVSEIDPHRTALAVQLINDIDRARRKRKLVQDFRRILGPLREADPTGCISAVGRLVEGGADVVRAQPCDDTASLPEKPALIEFADVGTVAYCLNPDRCRTVAIKSHPRARIMRLAENLHAADAPNRGARQRRRRVISRTQDSPTSVGHPALRSTVPPSVASNR